MMPRVGHIKFLNALPLYEGMKLTGFLDLVELIKGTPRELIAKLRAGDLELSAISSIEYCMGDTNLLIIPEISISAQKAVESVILLSKLPITQLDRRKISLSNASSTSQVLLKILLEEYFCIKPAYIETEPYLPSMLEKSDAALLIGDPALLASFRYDNFFKYDLSTEWYKFTEMSMNYAIWVISEEYTAREPDRAALLAQGIRKAMRVGEVNLSKVAALASSDELPEDRLENYFKKLSFTLSNEDLNGLEFFFRKAYDLGLIERVPAFRFFGD